MIMLTPQKSISTLEVKRYACQRAGGVPHAACLLPYAYLLRLESQNPLGESPTVGATHVSGTPKAEGSNSSS